MLHNRPCKFCEKKRQPTHQIRCISCLINLPIVVNRRRNGKSKLRGLTWDDLDFKDDGSIHITKQLIYRRWSDGKCYNKVKSVKYTASERVIPMEPKVRESLLAERERQKTLPDRNIVIDGYSGWVFLNRYGLVLSPKSANDAIDSIINRYNANEKEVASLEKRDPVYLPH